MSYLSNVKRGLIIGAGLAGASVSRTANIVGISRTTVSKVMTAYTNLATPPVKNPDCQKPKDVGPCKARIPRFFYCPETQMCEPFVYGGCKGNQNNFETKEQCESQCGSCKKWFYVPLGTSVPPSAQLF